MTDDAFDFYFAKVEGDLASIFVNMTIEKRAPVARYGGLIVVRVTMLDPRDDGLSSNEEFDALVAVETALSDAMTARDNAIYVGRVTYAGLRDFYYYAIDANSAGNAATRGMKASPEYKFEVLSEADAGWTTYRDFLYPSARDRQRMGNRHVCEQLYDGGDPLTEPREIDHWAFFETAAARDAFVVKATAIGYKLRANLEPDPAENRNGYAAEIYREDVPGTPLFDAITLELFDLATQCGGEYDGWEAPVMAPKEKPN
jgi:regulator of RNase E activity RraB